MAPYLGRASPVAFVRAPVADMRRGPVAGWAVPCGMNAQARTALTLAAVTTRLRSGVARGVEAKPAWTLALLKCLTDESSIMGHFWTHCGGDEEELRIGLTDLYLQSTGARPQGPDLAGPLLKTVTDRLLLESSKAGQESWKEWVHKALENGAKAAHRFANAVNAPPVPVPLAADGSLNPMSLATESTATWSRT